MLSLLVVVPLKLNERQRTTSAEFLIVLRMLNDVCLIFSRRLLCLELMLDF